MAKESLASLHGGEIEWAISKKYNIPMQKIVSFASTVSDRRAKEAHKTAMKFPFLGLYPPKYPYSLIDTLCASNGSSKDQIVIGSGSEELIYLFVRAHCKGEAIIPVPTYSSYEAAAKFYGIKNKFVKLDQDFDLDNDEIQKNITKNTSAIFLCNPNNPTGRLYDRKKVLELAKISRDYGIKLLLDENYMWFVDRKKRYSCASLVKEYPLFVINGISKFFGIPSLRLGWGVGDADVSLPIKRLKVPWSVNYLAIWTAEMLLSRYKNSAEEQKEFNRDKLDLYNQLSEIRALQVYKSDSNFFLVKILDKHLDSTKIFQILAKKGIIIRDGSGIRGAGHNYMRITIKNRNANAMLVVALKKIFGST